MKKCPFCAEEIKDEAIKCKHCGEWLFKYKDRPVNEKGQTYIQSSNNITEINQETGPSVAEIASWGSEAAVIDSFREARALFEKQFLRRKLAECRGNISLLAEKIGLERSHLYRKLKAYGLLPR